MFFFTNIFVALDNTNVIYSSEHSGLHQAAHRMVENHWTASRSTPLGWEPLTCSPQHTAWLRTNELLPAAHRLVENYWTAARSTPLGWELLNCNPPAAHCTVEYHWTTSRSTPLAWEPPNYIPQHTAWLRNI